MISKSLLLTSFLAYTLFFAAAEAQVLFKDADNNEMMRIEQMSLGPTKITRVGIGVTNPQSTLQVAGQVQSTGLKITFSSSYYTLPLSNADGYLKNDGNGTLTWASVGTGVGDNLGNHTAEENLKMGNYWISNDGGDEGIWIATSGRIGIGTSTPNTNASLDINGTLRVNNHIRGGQDYLGFYDDTGGAKPAKMGSLVISSSYSNEPPANGLFVSGNTQLIGDLAKIRNVNYTWPSAAASSASVLANSGSAGTLTWKPQSDFATANHTHATLSNGDGLKTFSYNGSAAAAIDLTDLLTAQQAKTYYMADITVNTEGRITNIADGGPQRINAKLSQRTTQSITLSAPHTFARVLMSTTEWDLGNVDTGAPYYCFRAPVTGMYVMHATITASGIGTDKYICPYICKATTIADITNGESIAAQGTAIFNSSSAGALVTQVSGIFKANANDYIAICVNSDDVDGFNIYNVWQSPTNNPNNCAVLYYLGPYSN